MYNVIKEALRQTVLAKVGYWGWISLAQSTKPLQEPSPSPVAALELPKRDAQGEPTEVNK